ncbi:OmpA family protein [Aureibaculum marinum]|uniref:OmpA family protein n=1 Tax=Aureibaculum marinum TaxID=2487930 RepID=A0A3N4NUC0_9FLAO|nr:OmpA family protein [Aureibaculum marinum]RPD96626.1 OmpA family protein [Aureibaculum marinum]
MKSLHSIILILLFFFLATPSSEAQFLKKLGKKVEQAAERAVIKKTEQKVTKETEKAMDSILNPKTGKMEKRENKSSETNTNGSDKNSSTNKSDNHNTESPSSSPTVWTKYNFVPGDEIIFDDNLQAEENGEFPSRWDLLKGNAENAKMGDENVITLNHNSIIAPLIDGDDYLPDVFTVEFDAYFDEGYTNWQRYLIRLYPGSNGNYEETKGNYYYPIITYKNGASMNVRLQKNSRTYNGYDESVKKEFAGWRHIALSFNKRSLKLFVDEYRALNIPNLQLNPKAISIGSYRHNPEGKIIAIKNIKIAKGGKALYDRVMEDGKFITRGILFDVNKASIKPESYGVINEVFNMMKEHKNLNFKIEGHTDSDGAEDYNLKLSAERAAAVKTALVELGISENRLQTEGKGETIPVADNSTPEGKANNRRVEFIKNN